jgi:hypothetical protein
LETLPSPPPPISNVKSYSSPFALLLSRSKVACQVVQ